VSHLVVNGTIVGPVHATEFLELQPRSRVNGDVHYSALEMHLGAIVEGRLVHAPTASESKTVELKLAKSS
jgi:cytoskeletal protein CcmA (bactofilin family)